MFGLFLVAFLGTFALGLLGAIVYTAYVYTVGFLTVSGGIGALLGVAYLWAHRRHREPGLILLYLKAKKEKVCPFIEFE